MIDEPEFMVCLNCDSPSYAFEWSRGKAVTVICEICGNDDPEEFVTENEYDEMSS
ncbi:MAG: hypothetical protein ABI718_07905 [Acidobacteriota bacterium]